MNIISGSITIRSRGMNQWLRSSLPLQNRSTYHCLFNPRWLCVCVCVCVSSEEGGEYLYVQVSLHDVGGKLYGEGGRE